jgi:hypothetical protein
MVGGSGVIASIREISSMLSNMLSEKRAGT